MAWYRTSETIYCLGNVFHLPGQVEAFETPRPPAVTRNDVLSYVVMLFTGREQLWSFYLRQFWIRCITVDILNNQWQQEGGGKLVKYSANWQLQDQINDKLCQCVNSPIGLYFNHVLWTPVWESEVIITHRNLLPKWSCLTCWLVRYH